MKGILEAMILLDANIILRYLVDEDVEALNKAEEYIRRKFVDCVLFAYHKLLGFEVATFDKQLIKLISRIDEGEII